jgi:Lysophospholipase
MLHKKSLTTLFLAASIIVGATSTTALTPVQKTPRPVNKVVANRIAAANVGAESGQTDFVPIVSWSESDVTAWANLICVHGLGLHKYVYEPFGKQMARVGINTYAIDVRGFGSFKNSQSGSEIDLKTTITDLKGVVEEIRMVRPGMPIVLLGESMGGAIVLQFAAQYPDLVDGVIACVPSGARYAHQSEKLKTVVGLFKGGSKPMNVGPGMLKRVTADEELRDTWANDPKARLLLSPKELIRFQNFMNQTAAAAAKLTDPVLMVQGGQDRLVKATGTEDLFRKIGTADKDFVMLGNAEHLIFEEGQFDEQSVNVISGWILKHVVASRFRDSKGATAGDGQAQVMAAVNAANPNLKLDPVVHQRALGHFFLAQGYLQLNQPERSKEQFKEVIQIAPGTLLAQESDALLSTALNDEKGEPAANSRLEKVVPQFVSFQNALANGKPTMIAFYSKWLIKRQGIWEAIQQLQLDYSDRINLVRLDVDDPKNAEIVKHFHVCAIPTFAFLNEDNKLVDERIGCTEKRDIASGIAKILPLSNAASK